MGGAGRAVAALRSSQQAVPLIVRYTAVGDRDMNFAPADDPSFAPALRENRQVIERSQEARLMAAMGDFDGAQARLDAMQKFLSTRQNVNQERNYNQTAGYVALKQMERCPHNRNGCP